MNLRDLLITAIVVGSLPVTVFRPFVGVLVWTWLAYMNPHRLSWGFAYSMPFSQMVGAATLVGLVVSSERKSFPWRGSTVILALWVLWLNFTTLFAMVPEYAWPRWERVMKIMLMNGVALLLIASKERLNAFVIMIALSIGFFGIRGGVFTILEGGQYLVWGPPESSIEGNNALGLALLMIFPLLNYLRLHASQPWLRSLYIGTMGASIIAVLGTYSRGAFLGAGAMLFFLWTKSRQKVLIAVVLLVAVPFLLQFMPDKWTARMNTIETYEEDGSALGRINAWWFAWNVAKERPLIGGGFDVFDPGLFQKYAPEPDDFHDAHSVYFEVLGEQGFVGLALFGAFYVLTWRTGSWTIRKCKDRPDLMWASDLSRMVQVSMVAYAVSGAFLGMAYFDLYYNIASIMILARVLVEREVAAPAVQREPAPALAGGLPAPIG